jgi:hypothetical protein
MTFSIVATNIEYCCAECRYAEYRDLFIIMLNVITQSVVMLSVVMLSFVVLSVVAPQPDHIYRKALVDFMAVDYSLVDHFSLHVGVIFPVV